MRRRILRRSAGTVYADFGFSMAEVLRCALCGIWEHLAFKKEGFTLLGYSVRPSRHCPVAGLVGLCRHCLDKARPETFAGAPYSRVDGSQRTWTPPPLVQIGGDPVYVIRRGLCDEERLISVVRRTWRQIPSAVRSAMRRHLRPREDGLSEERDHSFACGALRLEALPNWPGRQRSLAECWHEGHAIRLHAPTVSAMLDDVLSMLIAHEFAHCYQYAARQDPTEVGVIKIMGQWGFRDEDIDDWARQRDEERWQARMDKLDREIAASKEKGWKKAAAKGN